MRPKVTPPLALKVGVCVRLIAPAYIEIVPVVSNSMPLLAILALIKALAVKSPLPALNMIAFPEDWMGPTTSKDCPRERFPDWMVKFRSS